MNKTTWSIAVLGGLIILSLVGLIIITAEGPDENPPVTSFEECVEAGNPVMESYPRQCRSDSGEVFVETVDEEVSGTITEIDNSQIAADGPTEITLESDSETVIVAVPSMGINLCAAADNIIDISSLEVGDVLDVRGRLDMEGRIVPCESELHYLELSSEEETET